MLRWLQHEETPPAAEQIGFKLGDDNISNYWPVVTGTHAIGATIRDHSIRLHTDAGAYKDEVLQQNTKGHTMQYMTGYRGQTVLRSG